MLKQKILEDLKKVVKELGHKTIDIVLSIPKNPSFGDYTTNLVLQLAKVKSTKGKQIPTEIANEILQKFEKPDYLLVVHIDHHLIISEALPFRLILH